MYERFLQKWFGLDPVRERDRRGPDHPMVWIGGQVRAARVAASLTQLQVEELTGVDQTTVSRLETGKGPRMPLHKFAAILVAIDAEIRPSARSAQAGLPSWLAPAIELDDDVEDDLGGDPEGDLETETDLGFEGDNRSLTPKADDRW